MSYLTGVALSLIVLNAAAWAAGTDDVARAYATVERSHSATIGQFDGTLPQIVDGDSWQTTIVLTNLVSQTAYYRIFFNNDAGGAQAMDFVGLGRASSVIGQLAAGQSVEIATTGTANTLTQGAARMFNYDRPPTDPAAQLTESRIGGYAIFRRRLPGLPDQEAVVPMSDPFEKAFSIPFDNRNGFLTGVAIINDTTQTGTLTVVARDQAGNVLVNESSSMAAGLKLVYLVRDKYPALANRAGVLQFSISTIGLSGLGLRFNPTGSFTSTPPLSY